MPARPVAKSLLRKLFWAARPGPDRQGLAAEHKHWLFCRHPGWLARLSPLLTAQDFDQLETWDEEVIAARRWEQREIQKINQRVRVWLEEMRAESMFPRPKDDGRLTEDQLQRARDFPIQELVGPLKHGRIACPFHNGKDSNMAVYDTMVKCFVCGAKADPIAWVMKLEGLSFPQAVRKLAGG